MRFRHAVARLFVGVALTSASTPGVSAQSNPLDRTEGGGTITPLGGVGPTPPALGGPIAVPEYIQPGARIVYYGGDSSESDDPSKPGGAGLGMFAYDVVKVLPDRVLLQTSLYLDRNGNRQAYSFASATGSAVGAFEANSGGAVWIHPDELKKFQTAEGITVSRGAWPIGNDTYQAVTVTIVGNDSKTRHVFDEGTGLKLSEQIAVGAFRRAGGQNDGFNRKHQSHKGFEAFRQVQLPWLGHPAPAWVKTFKKLHYRGTYQMHVPGSPPMPIGISASFEPQQRGDDWFIGTMSQQMDAVDSGFGAVANPPTVTPVVEGPGKRMGLWVPPGALQAMRPGVVDRDDTLRTTLRYDVQDGPLGRLGVLTETDDTGSYQLVAGYRFDDGTLTYAQMSVRETGVTVTLELAGRE